MTRPLADMRREENGVGRGEMISNPTSPRRSAEDIVLGLPTVTELVPGDHVAKMTLHLLPLVEETGQHPENEHTSLLGLLVETDIPRQAANNDPHRKKKQMYRKTVGIDLLVPMTKIRHPEGRLRPLTSKNDQPKAVGPRNLTRGQI